VSIAVSLTTKFEWVPSIGGVRIGWYVFRLSCAVFRQEIHHEMRIPERTWVLSVYLLTLIRRYSLIRNYFRFRRYLWINVKSKQTDKRAGTSCSGILMSKWVSFICCCRPCFYINLLLYANLLAQTISEINRDYWNKWWGTGPPMYHLPGKVISATNGLIYINLQPKYELLSSTRFGQFLKFGKIGIGGTVLPSHPKGKTFCTGSEFSFVA